MDAPAKCTYAKEHFTLPETRRICCNLMARQVVEMEEELGRIWRLVSELSGRRLGPLSCGVELTMLAYGTDQLHSNRALVSQLMSRSDNVKGQAVHVGTGFPLRRFNLDIGDGRSNQDANDVDQVHIVPDGHPRGVSERD